jgi:hypothetical protein
MTVSSSSPLNRRSVLIGTALLGIGGVAIARQPKPDAAPVRKEALDRLVPAKVGDWAYHDTSGLVLPPPDALSDALYSGLVTRTYISPNRMPVMLLVAYSNVQDGMLQVHRPEVCYPAGGYRLSPTRVEQVPNGVGGGINANLFSAEGVSRTEQVRANLDGRIPDGILVRVSTLAPGMGAAHADLAAFAAQLVKSASPSARQLLIGRA